MSAKATQEGSARNVHAIKELLAKQISEAEFKKQTAAIRKTAMNTNASNDILECQIDSCKKELNTGVKNKLTTSAEYKTFLNKVIRSLKRAWDSSLTVSAFSALERIHNRLMQPDTCQRKLL
jgi:mRNA deadenylase 3'-5' endonuclease subunit Ccr4